MGPASISNFTIKSIIANPNGKGGSERQKRSIINLTARKDKIQPLKMIEAMRIKLVFFFITYYFSFLCLTNDIRNLRFFAKIAIACFHCKD